MKLTDADVFALLTDMRRSLDSDGYDLDCSIAADTVTLRVDARPDACDDCLVGKPVMRSIAGQALREMDPGLRDEEIIIQYPSDV